MTIGISISWNLTKFEDHSNFHYRQAIKEPEAYNYGWWDDHGTLPKQKPRCNQKHHQFITTGKWRVQKCWFCDMHESSPIYQHKAWNWIHFKRYPCSSFLLLNFRIVPFNKLLSQAEKKITVVTSWPTNKMTTVHLLSL